MSDLPDSDLLQRVAQQLDPQATLLAAWPLQGGISAQMTALEIALADGQRRKVIVRRAGERTLQQRPHAIQEEFRILQIVHAAGVKAQRPLLLETSGALLPTPYMLIDYIEGAPDLAPADTIRAVEQMATQLARIHQIKAAALDVAFLPRQSERLARRLHPPPHLDESLQEGEIRAALAPLTGLLAPTEERLLHGDFWPGNLLWRAGELVAVIDWEDAGRGNPLEDFAIARLDISWFYGAAAMRHFSERYRALLASELDFQPLPYWDLLAALRPAGQLDEWAAGLAELGRADMSAGQMRAVHRHFVQQALAALAA